MQIIRLHVTVGQNEWNLKWQETLTLTNGYELREKLQTGLVKKELFAQKRANFYT